MKIKTFPLQFTEKYLNEIRKVANDNGMSIKELMLTAIEEKVKRLKEDKNE